MEVDTGGRGHKQSTGPGMGHRPRTEGYGCSGVAHTESAGRGTGYLKERNESILWEHMHC